MVDQHHVEIWNHSPHTRPPTGACFSPKHDPALRDLCQRGAENDTMLVVSISDWVRTAVLPAAEPVLVWDRLPSSKKCSRPQHWGLTRSSWMHSATFIILSKNYWSLLSLPYASPCLWNQVPFSFRQLHSGTSSSISYSPIPSPITFSSSDSPLCASITPSLFHSRLKTTSFTNPTTGCFTSSFRTASTDLCLDRFFWATRFFIFFSLFFSFLDRALD